MVKTNDKFLIGIDIGTTNIKGSIYSVNGENIFSYQKNYNTYSPIENYFEQDPDDWVKIIKEILEKLLIKDNMKNNILAISLSTQGGTVVPVDDKYLPLTNAITWMDNRGIECLSDNMDLMNKNIWFYNKTGWRLNSNVSFMPLYWIKKNKPELFNKINKVLFVNDYVLKKIADTSVMDPSNASITLLYNIVEGNWDRDILNLLNINENKLSEVKKSGQIIGNLKKEICEEIGIKGEVKIVNGGHDQYCAAIGAGIFSDNQILLSTGTAWVIYKLLNKPLFDSDNFFGISRNIIEDKFGLIYAIPAAGASLKWMANNLLNLHSEKELIKLINENVNKLKNIYNDLIFYPYLTGSSGPEFNQKRKASFLNISINHSYMDFIKAVLEGIAFQLKKIFIVLEDNGVKVDALKMVGGGTRDGLWSQIVADVLNLKVLVPCEPKEDFAVRGAVIIAAYGIGLCKTLEDCFGVFEPKFRIVEPSEQNREFYKKKFMEFERGLN